MVAGAEVALQGGEALRKKLEEISKQIRGAYELKVGFLEDATYPDENHTSVAQVAWWLNYGTKTAPARPFFTDMVKDKSDEWGPALADNLRDSNFDLIGSLMIVGEGIRGQLQQAIIDMDSPKLSKITLMLRKMRHEDPDLVVTGATVGEAARRVADGESTSPASEKVGIYTGHMLNSVDFIVEKTRAR